MREGKKDPLIAGVVEKVPAGIGGAHADAPRPVEEFCDLSVDPSRLSTGSHDDPRMLTRERVDGKLAPTVDFKVVRVDETLVAEVDTGHAILLPDLAARTADSLARTADNP